MIDKDGWIFCNHCRKKLGRLVGSRLELVCPTSSKTCHTYNMYDLGLDKPQHIVYDSKESRETRPR